MPKYDIHNTQFAAHNTQILRLENIIERNPRRCGRYALRMLQEPHAHRDSTTLLVMGWALLRWERLEPTTSVLALAQARIAEDDALAGLYCRRLQLMLRQLQGESSSLQMDWEAHIQDCTHQRAMRELIRSRCEQIAHLNLLGQYYQARMLADEIRQHVQKHGRPADQARYAYVLGVAAIGISELELAQHQLNLAYDCFAQLRYPAEFARVCFERAWLYLRREQLEYAEHDLHQALKIYTTLELPYRIALCQRDLGAIALYQANYAQAITQFSIAQEQFRMLGRADQVGGCDFNIGSVAYMTGMYDLAMGMYRQAQLHYETIQDQFHACVAIRNQILVLCAQQSYDQALQLCQELALRPELSNDLLAMAELRSTRAKALQGLKRYGQALAELEQAHADFIESGNHAAAAECLLDMAWLHLEIRQFQQALSFLERIANRLDNRPTHYWRICYGLGRIRQADNDYKAALGYYLQAIAIVSTLRKELLSEHVSSQIFLMARQLYQDALQLASEQNQLWLVMKLAEQQHALVFDQQIKMARIVPSHMHAEQKKVAHRFKAIVGNTRDSEALKQALNSYIDSIIRTRNHSFLATNLRIQPSVEELTLELLELQLNKAYGRNWSVLYPLFLHDKILLIGITSQGIHMQPHDITNEDIQLIERACQPGMRLQLYRDLERLQKPELPAWNSLCRLADLLLPKWLRERLDPNHRLIIIPSGRLHMLPWAALRLEHAWLCEQAIIQLSPSLSRISGCVSVNKSASALLIGCQSFDGRAAELPATLHSLELASAIWQGESTVLTGNQASCAAINTLQLQGSLQHYELIHIASHAQLGGTGGADGVLAHIKLSDDDLLLDEILQLRLQAKLLVLAACEGGAGKILPGDEILGLSRALLIAGARAVLANLWPINDRSNLAILSAFYQALGTGLDATAALAYAQRSLLSYGCAEEDAILQSPLIWGGFTLMTCRS